MSFAYSADSGQNYSIIAKAGGMRQRIMDDGNSRWKSVTSRSYRPLPDDPVACIMAMAE